METDKSGGLYRGRPDGLTTKWHENGQMKSQETFVKVRSQEKQTWDEDGTGTTEIEEALNISAGAKAAISEYYMDRGEFPADNESAGLADGSEITGRYVTSDMVDTGVITIRLAGDAGNRALILTPTYECESIISWQCSSPDIAPAKLPEMCR